MMAAHGERFISARAGNGLRAVGEIKAGAVIQLKHIKGGDTKSSAPFAFCIARKFLQTACHNCVRTGEKLLRCSQCKTARYCSVQCQKEAWPEHKSECPCLKRVHPRIPTDSVRLTARIIFRLLSDPAADAEELYSVAEHQPHLEDKSDEQREGLAHLCSTLMLYLGQENADPSLPNGLTPIGLLARVTCNCFSISNGELQDVGVGLYPSMSLLNHDCRPNCVVVFLGRRLQLRAVRNIRANEELTISYTEVLAPRVERRAQLQQQYHFLCQCQRCSREDTDRELLAGDDAVWTILRDKLPQLEKLQAENHWEELLKESEALISTHASAVPDTNVYLLRLLDMAMDACISLDQYEKALEFGKRTLGPYQLHYPDPHPSRAVELLRVGKLQHYLGKLEDAQSNFRQAYDVMKVTHGTDHSLINEVQRKLEECQAELGRVQSS
ncbi:histone-lysine N-methyltransferase SMYD3 isoform X2 [Colossoma macropomum]|uniref:histone-lysine N-methyltransferase SMYD3 isoform X2 n=1 Tax=Colossoma macropomum TaxID=42526 RepID=UPI001863D946|nr:histone-lysine N-methyltransferase SMYD3 isoform X2 [Colossoma macropomum]